MKRTCAGRHMLSGAHCHLSPRHDGPCNGWAHYPGQLVSWYSHRDKRNRIVGYNWWRSFIVAELHAAEAAWQAMRESGQPINTDVVPGATYDTAYYQLSEAEYRLIHERPTLRGFLETHRGMTQAQFA